jgi:hypothetical protein
METGRAECSAFFCHPGVVLSKTYQLCNWWRQLPGKMVGGDLVFSCCTDTVNYHYCKFTPLFITLVDWLPMLNNNSFFQGVWTLFLSAMQFYRIWHWNQCNTCLFLQVYKLSIGAACALTWPPDRIIIQVLDDSTDPIIKVHQVVSLVLLKVNSFI